MARQPETPRHVERGAQIVGELLKMWPPKEAPARVHITFCEELQGAIEAYQTDENYGWWFSQLGQELGRSIATMKRLVASTSREAESIKERLDGVAQAAPGDLWRAVHEAG
jgi:hypothetical protein